jgi:hypothetical protein
VEGRNKENSKYKKKNRYWIEKLLLKSIVAIKLKIFKYFWNKFKNEKFKQVNKFKNDKFKQVTFTPVYSQNSFVNLLCVALYNDTL